MSETLDDALPVEESAAAEAVEAPEAAEAPKPAEEVVVAADDAKVHPAYEKLLAELPEAWHNKVIPHLQEQDKNFQQQLEKFTPFKEFLEFDPTVIRDSMKLADVAVNDPVSLYRNLADHLRSQGLIEEAEAADETADEIEESEDYEIDPAIKKEFDRRDAQLQQQQEMLDSIEYQKQVEQETQVLEQQVQEMTAKYDIPDATLERILKLMEVQLERGEDATVYTAARELSEITGVKYSIRGDLPKADAPLIVGSSGGAGVPTSKLEIPSDPKAKKEMLAQMFRNQMSQQ